MVVDSPRWSELGLRGIAGWDRFVSRSGQRHRRPRSAERGGNASSDALIGVHRDSAAQSVAVGRNPRAITAGSGRGAQKERRGAQKEWRGSQACRRTHNHWVRGQPHKLRANQGTYIRVPVWLYRCSNFDPRQAHCARILLQRCNGIS